jgi:hypothetical protein
VGILIRHHLLHPEISAPMERISDLPCVV